nr:putative uncharacterized protein FLJ44672 [Gorilla gorilla gorilla]XP_055222817.1 putative uncharacterized protein FLJ44672 [Gorilla gorilla gorilla]
MSLLPHNSLHRHSSIVTMASLDPAPASQPSLQALSFLKSTSPGPAHASLQPLQAQLLHLGPSRPSLCLLSASTVPTSISQQILQAQHLPHCGPPKPSSQPFSSFYTPSSRLPVASSGPWGSFLTTAFPGPVFPFRRPLWAENLLKSASPDHLHPPGVLSGPSSSSWLCLQARLLPVNNLFGLSAYPSPGVLGWPTASSSHAPQAQVRPHGGLSRMSSCPPMAPAGPKWSPVGGLLHAKLGPPGDLCRPKLS